MKTFTTAILRTFFSFVTLCVPILHTCAVRLENLLLRIIGKPEKQRDGKYHDNKLGTVVDPYNLPF